MKKTVVALLLVFVTVVLCSCGSHKLEKADFAQWYNQQLSPAYDSYVKAVQGEASFPSLSVMLTNSRGIEACFAYIADGTVPEKGTLTEENGIYTYREDTYYQTFEFNGENTALKVTMVSEFMGETETDFIAVIRQKGDYFYIQYLMPVFGEYIEVKFNEEGGEEYAQGGCYELPYDISAQDIPNIFAKES